MTIHRFSQDDVVTKLELARRLELDGHSVNSICRQLEVSELTYLRWYKKYSGLDAHAVVRLRVLEEENARLRRGLHGLRALVADLADQVEQDPPVRLWLAAVPAQQDLGGGAAL